MADKTTPDALRFSLFYQRRGEPTDDSPKMRRRVAALIDRFDVLTNKGALGREIEREQGVDMARFIAAIGPHGASYSWPNFLAKAHLEDVLDVISTATKVLRDRGASTDMWIDELRRIFSEEHVRYTLTDAGAVRFSIDEQFELGVVATVAALGGERYSKTAAALDAALVSLSATPPRGKDAIRGLFGAVEGLFRLMFSNAPRLGGAEIDAHLRPVVEALFADSAARGAALKSLRSFKEWVDAAHFYRHEPNHAEPSDPPLELAVLLISQGVAWLRWLAEIDRGNPA